jgi:hypothetical protein
MPGLVPGIHVLSHKQDVDGRDKRGHDECSHLHGFSFFISSAVISPEMVKSE